MMLNDEFLSDLSKRGLALYDEHIKGILEPEHNNEFVAIHVPTADYAVAKSSGDAMRAILIRHSPDGQLVIRKIGQEPEYQLVSRILAGEMLAGHRK